MLYVDKLEALSNESEKATGNLFEKAKKNQSHPNDLLLVLINGFFYDDLVDNHLKLSPYVIGQGEEGFADRTQYEFFHSFRTGAIAQSKDELLVDKGKIDKEEFELSYRLTTQLELMVYLKFWESDFLLRQFYNLVRLIHGESFDWHKKMKDVGRKHLIENEIILKAKNKAPNFFDYISKAYVRQIRNAAAHSQFFIHGDYINFTNSSKDAEQNHRLVSLHVDDWEDIFHRTILLYNFFIKFSTEYEKLFKTETIGKHFGKQIRITTKDDKEMIEWVKIHDDRWMWYVNWAKSEIKRFHITII